MSVKRGGPFSSKQKNSSFQKCLLFVFLRSPYLFEVQIISPVPLCGKGSLLTAWYSPQLC